MVDRYAEKNPNYKTGFATKGHRPSFYISWVNMKQRCTNHKNPNYARYGGRGITIDPTWLTIEGFSEWAFSSGWSEGLTIDRINNDGNYSPDNCQWVSMAANSRKKRTTKLSLSDAQTIRNRVLAGENERAIAKEYGVVHGTIWFIVNGYTHVEDGECTKKLMGD